MKKAIIIATILTLASASGILFVTFFLIKDSAPPIQSDAATATEISFSAVQTRNTVEDCWIAYGGRVFSITRLIESTQNKELGLLCGKAIDTLPTELPKERLLEFQVGILSL